MAKLQLRSGDGDIFEVDGAALQSQTVNNMLEDTGPASTVLPVPNITSKILGKIIDYCNYHADAQKKNGDNEEEIKAWDKEYVNVDQQTLFDLILAVNFLNIKPLLDLTCRTLANILATKSVEEIREMFNIKNDFTPEEEAEARKENPWAFS